MEGNRKKVYRIAGHMLVIGGSGTSELLERMGCFVPFLSEESSACPDLTIETDRILPSVPGILFYESFLEIGHLRIYKGKACFLCSLQSSDGYNSFHLLCFPGRRKVLTDSTSHPDLLRFGFWVAYNISFAMQRTIAIHASVITCNGKAVLFLGESGTGKSTHTRIWCEYISGAVLLNDDSPVVRITEGYPLVSGSPWSGKTPCYKNEAYPLIALVRLKQAPYNRISELSVLRALGAVYPSCPPELMGDVELSDAICMTISDVLQRVPVYILECLPDPDAAGLVYQTIFRS